MSIERYGSAYLLICDTCGDSDGKNYYDWDDARDAKKDNGWKSRKVKGEWEDVCEDCQAAERGA